ncbi:Lumazine-binding protein [Eremomyces bilateralis CBS 781.70]|uniref:Riboflavin synthase n=1 Tax=Eremomyces bilateralis CBS 781.70 TaxID=1392243 RepID=A0A6G1G3Z9_9PEZI|nr:Lumazine-binding protein [Eremomyces bilateralis CBS 781.70]KAF1812825.1 Lumazine-binding protein [Eremomyces bilateralis CBS 781.70]
MFTGIVEVVGIATVLLTSKAVSKLEELDKTSSGGSGTSLTISNAEEILGDCHLGDSISINGTCLTVTEFDKSSFKVGVAPETLRRTNLGDLKANSGVNLERAVSAHTRMGGHFVQGHVDTVATILSVTPDGNALTFRLQPRDPSVLRYIVEKGFITLDGASLTVTKVEDGLEGWWEVMLIAYTQEKVVMGKKGVGEGVNVEVDMVGKYVEKSVGAYFEGVGVGGEAAVLEKMVGRIVEARLAGSIAHNRNTYQPRDQCFYLCPSSSLLHDSSIPSKLTISTVLLDSSSRLCGICVVFFHWGTGVSNTGNGGKEDVEVGISTIVVNVDACLQCSSSNAGVGVADGVADELDVDETGDDGPGDDESGSDAAGVGRLDVPQFFTS